jgi:hypothetical protein
VGNAEEGKEGRGENIIHQIKVLKTKSARLFGCADFV